LLSFAACFIAAIGNQRIAIPSKADGMADLLDNDRVSSIDGAVPRGSSS